MKALFAWIALFFASQALAGGAIGGSTGAKCFEFMWMTSAQFEAFHERVEQALLQRSAMIIHGEHMRVAALDEGLIEMTSFDENYTLIIQLSDED